MIKAVAIILTVVIVAVVVGSAGYICVKAGGNMINQNYAFGEAVNLAWTDYTILISEIFGKAKAEDGYFEYPITTNMYIEVKACTGL